MKIWLITDTHLNHENIIKVHGRSENFESILLGSLKSSLQKGDALIHVGDICFKDAEDAHERLMASIPEGCKKILVLGNHDNRSDSWYYAHGWDFVCRSFTIQHKGFHIIFSHKPLRHDMGCDMNIHGHFHDNDHREFESAEFYNTAYHKRLAIEFTGFKPISLDAFLEQIVCKSCQQFSRPLMEGRCEECYHRAQMRKERLEVMRRLSVDK